MEIYKYYKKVMSSDIKILSPNPNKDTPLFHLIQIAKTEFIKKAIDLDNNNNNNNIYCYTNNIYAWIDFGIYKIFKSDDTMTHLMFIDADITFSWLSIVKLLLSKKELSGGCYPKKCFNWDKIRHHNQQNPNLKDEELMAKSLDYVFNPIYHRDGDNVVIRVENGMAQVKDIGTGFMMINKSVIRKMILKYPDTKYKNNVAGYGQQHMNDCFYSLFDCCIDPVSRVYLSEDYLFCKRWIDAGGELWLDINTNLNHTGIIDYKGCLGLIIGEIDTLNKDAQILQQQNKTQQAETQ